MLLVLLLNNNLPSMRKLTSSLGKSNVKIDRKFSLGDIKPESWV